MTQIDRQRQYFDAHKSQILGEYSGKVIVISDALDIYPFQSLEDGYKFGVEHFGYGNFLLKDCTQDPAQVQIISPVITLAQA